MKHQRRICRLVQLQFLRRIWCRAYSLLENHTRAWDRRHWRLNRRSLLAHNSTPDPGGSIGRHRRQRPQWPLFRGCMQLKYMMKLKHRSDYFSVQGSCVFKLHYIFKVNLCLKGVFKLHTTLFRWCCWPRRQWHCSRRGHDDYCANATVLGTRDRWTWPHVRYLAWPLSLLVYLESAALVEHSTRHLDVNGYFEEGDWAYVHWQWTSNGPLTRPLVHDSTNHVHWQTPPPTDPSCLLFRCESGV